MKNSNESDELWDDLLDDVASRDFRQSVLAETVRAATRRRCRRLIGAVACVAAPILLFALMRMGDRESFTPELAAVTPEAAAAIVEVVSETPAPSSEEARFKPEILTDDELFAMFPDHVVGLVGPVGEQRLVVLGERSK